MYQFDYHRAQTVAEAAELLAANDENTLLAGGQTLIPTLKQRLAMPATLVDIGNIADLSFIKAEGNAITIGAATKHADVASSPDVAKHLPALAHLAAHIGDPAVRNRGTIGGSLANNDPAADYPAAALGLDAKIHTNKRLIDAGPYFTGMFETALEDDEIITEITFPHPEKAAYVKFPNPASRYAMVGVFVAQTAIDIRVAVTGAGANGVFRVKEMEDALGSNWSPDAVTGIKVPEDDLLSDLHGAADYRSHLISVMAGRAVAATM